MQSKWKWLAGVIALGAIAAGLVWFNRIDRASLSHREVATQVLAEYVRKAASPKAVLVISNPYTQSSGGAAEIYAFQKASVAGLRKGFGDGIEVKVGFPKLKPDI